MLILWLTILLVNSHCGKGKSEADRIEEIFDEIARQVEEENTANLIHYLSEDFSDFEDRSREDISDLVEQYFQRYQNIVFHLLSTKVVFIRGLEAEVEVEISLSSGAARMFRRLIKFSGQLYRFNLELVKIRENWKIAYAEWRYITIEQLFPESFKVLKKIFPKL
jgi:hypothetical protein